jgi:hypothetical protein
LCLLTTRISNRVVKLFFISRPKEVRTHVHRRTKKKKRRKGNSGKETEGKKQSGRNRGRTEEKTENEIIGGRDRGGEIRWERPRV